MNLVGTSIAYLSVEVPMNQPQSNRSKNKPNSAPKFLRGASEDALQRIKDREPEEYVVDQENIEPIEKSFQSELDYDGYDSIEEYDNNAYRLNVEGFGNPTKELNFKERATSVLDDYEEDLIDPQDNES